MSLELKVVSELSNPEKYRRYSEKGVFFITHPGYDSYLSSFHIDNGRPAIENIVRDNFDDVQLKSERVAMMNFISVFQALKEITFMECLKSYGNLSILLIPKDYAKHSLDSKGYENYLRQLTANQENFITMESSEHNCGSFDYHDKKSLSRLFRAIGIHHAYLGGGHVMECQQSSNYDLAEMIDMVSLVPEASNVYRMHPTNKILRYKLKTKALIDSVQQGQKKVAETVYSHKGLCREIIDRTNYWLFKQATSFFKINMRTIVPRDRLLHPSVRMFYEKTGL